MAVGPGLGITVPASVSYYRITSLGFTGSVQPLTQLQRRCVK
jgi:hypothetical protein